MRKFLVRYRKQSERRAANSGFKSEALETRILFSADLPWLSTDGASTDSFAQLTELALTNPNEHRDSVAANASEYRQSLVLIDEAVAGLIPQREQLQAHFDSAGIVMGFLDSQQSGLDQISTMLAATGGQNSLQILTEASGDGLQLGNSFLGVNEVLANAEQVAGWRPYLDSEGSFGIFASNLSAFADAGHLTELFGSLTGSAFTAQDLLAPAEATAWLQKPALQTTELVFVDAGVEDYQSLVDDLRAQADGGSQFEIILIDEHEDGLARISNALQGRSDIDAVHIVSHGSDGLVELGNATLSAANVDAFAAQIGAWGDALGADADLLIYGCNLAYSDTGRSLVDELATLTGADVAASEDLTGSAALGGDWELEYQRGQIETGIAFSQQATESYDYVLATYTVSNLNDSGPGSLREAISQANANAGADVIEFSVAGTINLTSELPLITDQVIIDGTTAPGYSNAPLVFLDGSGAGSGDNGLRLDPGSDSSVIRGLGIVNFGDDGIDVRSDNNWVYGNYIGVDATGLAAAGNVGRGIVIQDGATGNRIGTNGDGSNDALERNVVGGNQDGIVITDSGTSNNQVSGNYIGVGIDGETVVANSSDGVNIKDSASSNIIGGSNAGEGNVISGNGDEGVQVVNSGTDGNQILGNLIGISADGSTRVGNAQSGIFVWQADNTIIGGTGANEHNIVGGNGIHGIEVYEATGTQIYGNYLGTDTSGTVDLGNVEDGVQVRLNASSTIVGGVGTDQANTIAFNRNGVVIETGSVGNTIRGNAIYSNIDIGIDLSALSYPDGTDANDAGDADSGGNTKLNTPTLLFANVNDGGVFTFAVDASALPAGSYTLDVYASTNGEGGEVEGQRYLTSHIGLAGGDSYEEYTAGGMSGLAPGEYITVTVTDAAGNTSEFSSYAVVVDGDTGGTTPSDLQVASTAQGGLVLNESGGNGAYLQADDGGAILGGLTALTVETRFSFTDTSIVQTLISYATDANPNSLSLRIATDGTLRIQPGTQNAVASTFDYHSLADGNPHTLSVTWDNTSGDWSVFVDGALADSGTGLSVGQSINTGGTLIIGQEQDSVGGGFSAVQRLAGTLHELRFFDTARSASEIELYDDREVAHNTANLIADWQFDSVNRDGVIFNEVSANHLTLRQVGGGFTNDPAELQLGIAEAAANGTIVGTVAGIDAERDAQIAAILALDATLTYSAESDKFYRAVTTTDSWINARAAATSATIDGVSGQLATIRSAAEQAVVAGIAADAGQNLFLGATQSGLEWRWQDGSADADQFWEGTSTGRATHNAYSNWAANEPGSVEPYLNINHVTGEWDDLTSSFDRGHLVEWDAQEVLDASLALTYTITVQSVDGAFAIDSQTGVVTVADGRLLDATALDEHSLTVQVTDADGRQYSEVMAVAIASANRGVTQQVPVSDSTAEDTQRIFSSANGNAITVDVEGASDGQVQTTLTVLQGRLILPDVTGITIVDGANGYRSVTLEGTESAINTALDGLIYEPDSDFNGADTLTITSVASAALQGQYTFDDTTASDTSIGVPNDGAFIGNAATETDPVRGEVLSLDGSGDYVRIDGMFDEPENVTLSAWVNFSSAAANAGEVISIGNMVALRVNDMTEGVAGFFYDGSAFQFVGTGPGVSLNDNQWHHVAFSFDDANNTQNLYIDGELYASASHTASIDYQNWSPQTTVGAHADPLSTGFDFTGTIDDARVYARALSADEIAALAADQTAQSNSIALTISADNDGPSFNTFAGYQNAEVSGSQSAQSMVVQPDGRIIIGGYDGTGTDNYQMVRYNVDGSLDTSFGVNGVVDTNFGGFGRAYTVSVQDDGSILLSGSGPTADAYIVRYNADGSVDGTFGSSGIAIVDVNSATNTAWDHAVGPDGSIYLSGSVSNGTDNDFVVTRLTAAGTVDTTFNGTGSVVVPNTGSDTAWAVAVQDNGQVVLAGKMDNPSWDVGLVRLNVDGSYDSDFGTGGIVLTDAAGGTDSVSDVIIQPDGQILVVGKGNPGASDQAMLVRYNTDGTLDSGFGSGGVVLGFSGFLSTGSAAVVLEDGSILMTGNAYPSGSADAYIAKFQADGTLDTSFGENAGYSLFDANGTTDFGADVAVLHDGSVVIATTSTISSGSDFTQVRFNGDGTRSTSFGIATDTLAQSVSYTENAAPILLDGDVDVSDPELDARNGGAGNYAGASVVLARSTGAGAQDLFGFSDGNGLSLSGSSILKNGNDIATFDTTGTAGQLTISFTDSNGEVPTSADVDNLLRQLTYANSSDAPDASVQIDWTFADGDGAQAAGTSIVNITGVNDAPVLNPTNLIANGDLATGDLTGWTTTGTVTTNGGNYMRFGEFNDTGPHSASQSFATVAGQVYTLSFDYRDDSASLSQQLQVTVDGASNNLTYNRTSSAAGTGYVSYTVSFVADASTSTIAFTDVSPSSTSVDGYVTNVSVVEQATFTSVTEDDIDNAGNTVASILASVTGDRVTDVDAGALEGIAIVDASSAFDYSIDGGASWQRVDQVNTFSALLLRATDLIRFVPQEVAAQSENIEFRAWDQSSGTAGSYASTATNGGDSAFSTSIEIASITTTDVNDAPTFGSEGGFAVGHGPGGYNTNHASLALSDGSVLFTPYHDSDPSAIGKLDPSGQLDVSFGNGGYFEASSLTYIRDIIEQPDGRFLVTGEAGNDIGLARYNADGTLDESFGTNGVTVTAASGNGGGYEVAVHSDGTIVVVGDAGNDSVVARYTSTGVLDTSFNGTGTAIINLGGTYERLGSVTVLADGSVLAAGESHVVRLTAAGALDTSFDGDGILSVGHRSNGLFVQSDGAIVVTGFSGDHLVASRFSSSGALDTSFGSGGTATWTDPRVLTSYGAKIVGQSDGKLIVAGTAETNSAFGYEMAVVRFNANGSLDTSFGDNGAWLSGLTEDYADAFDVSLYDDGSEEKIVVGGYESSYGFSRATIARLNADGTLDSSYQSGQLDGNPTYTEHGDPVVLDGNVQIFDREMSSEDDFSGATLTLERNGGASNEDVFGATGNLVLNAGTLELNATNVGTYTSVGGQLVLTFGNGADGEQVNEVMQSITYENTSDTPSASVQIDWTFSDGNSGAQGSGGALTATGATVVNIIASNDLAVANADSETTLQDMPLTFSPTDNDSDGESDAVSVLEYTQPANGVLVDNGDGTFTYTPAPGYTGADSFEYLSIDTGSGLQHYWGLGGNADDAIGFADGTVNGTTTEAAGFGNGLRFNESVSDYVELPDVVYNSELTVSFEFKVDEIDGSLFQYLYSHGDINSTDSINVFINEATHGTDPNVLRTVVRDGNDTLSNTALDIDIGALGLDLVDGQFHSYTMTAGADGVRVYIDGVLVATDSTRGTDGIDPTGSAYLGIRQDLDPDRAFGGVLDSVAIYDNALDQEAIANLASGVNRASANISVLAAAEPTQGLPTAQSVNEDSVLTFSAGGGNAVTVSDGQAGDHRLQITLSVDNGVLTLNGLTGLTLVQGSNGGSSLTVSGTEAAINAALEGMTFTPNVDFHGAVNLSVTTAIASDLAGEYTFEGNADDVAPGTANNGALVNGASIVTDAERGNVLSLNNSNQYVEIPGMFGNPADVTLAAWVNVNSGTFADEIISLGDNVALRSTDTAGGVRFIIRGTSGWQTVDSNINISGDGWTHVAATLNDATGAIDLYINGALVASATAAESIQYTQGTDTRIGENGNGLTHPMDGLIDDARIYTRALSAEEIAALAFDQVEATAVLAIAVDPVSDAPIIGNLDQDYIQAYNDGTGYRIDAAAGAALSDPDAPVSLNGGTLTVNGLGFAPQDTLGIDSSGSVTLSAGYLDGSELRVGGVAIGTLSATSSSGFTVSLNNDATSARVELAIQSVQFSSTSTAFGARQVEVTLNDGGGTANGGAEEVTVTTTVSLLGSGTHSISTLEDTGYTLTLADFEFAIQDTADLQSVTITGLPANGSLELNGAAVSADQSVSRAELIAGQLVFVPDTNESGIGYASFDFYVNSGSANVTLLAGEHSAYTLNSTYLPGLDAILANRDHFGPSGTVATVLQTADSTSTIDASYLATGQVLFDGFVADGSYSAAELTAIDSWVSSGGVLISTSDDAAYDALTGHFGLVIGGTASATWQVSDSSHPIMTGPFGTVGNNGDTFQATGSISYFDSASLQPGDEILAIDSVSGEPTMVLRAHGDGAILFTSDEGIFRADNSGDGTINTANDRLSANVFAWAVGQLDVTTNTISVDVDAVNDDPTGSVTISDTTPAQGQLLTAANSIADADGISGPISYQWYRDGAIIAGATGNSYTTTQNDVGAVMSVVASYTDDGGTAESQSSGGTAAVTNVNDPVAGQPVITGTPQEDQTLTADTSGISDADGLGTFSYQWYRDGGTIAGATGSTYSLGDADVGSNITVTVSYTDAYGTAESTSSSAIGPVTNINDTPTGAVTIDNTAPDEGDTLTASNTLADADGLSGPISYQWYRDGAIIAGATGNSYTTTQADVDAVMTVVASYTDDQGTAESQSSSGTGAVANINDPVAGQPVITGVPQEDQTLTADVSGISDEDGLGTFSYQWHRDGGAIAGATGNTYLLGDADVGANITVTVAYTDAHGAAENTTSSAVGPVSNINDTPTGAVTIDNTAPDEGDTLTASNTLADADGLSGPISYQWYRDGAIIVGATGSSYTTTQADVDAVMTVTASYTDDQGTAETRASGGTAAVANINDLVAGQPVITGTPQEDQTLTADTSGISDEDGLGTFSYQWHRDGGAIAGATSTTYLLGDADVGANITVTVSYTDAYGASESTTSPAVGPVANVNDTPTGVVTIDNTAPDEGDTLTASNTLADADGLSGPISYQWYRDGVIIAGATGSSYTTTQADVDAVMTVTASYTDDRGTAESVASSGTAAVANVNDPVAGQPVISGTAQEDQTLTADTSGISDEDGLGSFSYQWYRDGGAIAGATSNTYLLGDIDVGSNITVTVSYTDAYGASESTTSPAVGPVANVNDTPTGVVTIDNTAPDEGDTLTASNTLADADGLSGPISYQWYRDGAIIVGATGNSYITTQADVDAVMTVAVSYTDDRGTAESVASSGTAAVANVNDPVTGQPVISGTPQEDQTLTADTSGISDEDGLGTFSYQWHSDGGAIAGATGNTYLLGDNDVGSNITVTVSYTDAYGASESTTSSAVGPVANVNDTPTGTVTISDITPDQGDTLTASNTLADADGLSGPISYQWYRDGAVITGATGNSYTTTQADVGAVMSVTASYTDDQGTAENQSSSATGAVANVNDPVAGQPVITGTPQEDQTLTADTSGVSDADGLGTFSYQWHRDGGAVSGATGSTYLLGDADVGANITVTVSYTDGYGATENTTSSAVGPVANVNDTPTGTVTIDNIAPDQGDTLTASNTLADADGLSGPISYQWYRDGAIIAGATGNSYTTTQADVDAVMTVVASYTDDLGTAESVSSPGTAAVANVNDAIVGTPVILGTPQEDQTLTADTSGVSDADGLGTFSYQWLRDGAAITGATGSSYTLGDSDVDATIAVVVSYVDGYGAAESASSAPVGPVSNVNDAPTGTVNLSHSNPAQGDVLTLSQTLADADGLSGPISYQWQRDGIDVAGATGTSYITGQIDVGSTITVVARYTDDQGTLEQVSSAATAPVSDVNDTPVANADGLGTLEDTSLTINIATDLLANDTDLDGDTLSLSGFGQPAHGFLVDRLDGTLSYIPDADYNGPDQFDYTVSDGRGGLQTATVTINVGAVNDRPVLLNADPATIAEGQSAITALVGNDVDGDAVSYAITGGADAAAFVLDSSSGDLALTSTPDYEAPTDADGDNRYELNVTVTDSNGAQSSYPLTVTIADANEAPDVVDQSLNWAWQPGGAVAGQLTATDPDAGDSSTFRILAGNDAGHFTVNADDGTLAANDSAVPGTYELLVEVTDNAGVTDTAMVLLTIDPLPEATPPAVGERDGSQPGPGPAPEPPPRYEPPGGPVSKDPGLGPDISSPRMPEPAPANDNQAPETPAPLRGPAFPNSADGSTAEPTNATELTELQAPHRDTAETAGANESKVGRLVRLLLHSPDGSLGNIDIDGVDSQHASILIPVSPQLAEALDAMAESLGSDDDAMELRVAGAVGGAVTLSAGFVIWMLRAGSLLASFLATRPAFSQFDVMPIFDASEGDQDDDDARTRM